MHKTLFAAILVAAISLSTPAQIAPYNAALKTDAKSIQTGKPQTLDILLTDSKTKSPSAGLKVSATLSMPTMAGMSIPTPEVQPGGEAGHYMITLTLPHPGDYLLTLTVESPNSPKTTLQIKLANSEPMAMGDMGGMEMKATLGDWSANREGSGTSWQPDSSPMFMKMLPSVGGFETSAMGILQAGYVVPGSKRVGSQFFTNSMVMLMGRKDLGGGALGIDLMTSVDPIINGEEGVPNLFQTGETAHGVPLVDRQHPHNLFSEVAASYSHPLGPNWSAFVYGGPVGEPALGNVMFMHRTSGEEIPEATITHHWFDSTHISFGVATLGLVYQNRWKLEGSVFNGHEPGENRYTIGPVLLNSESVRLSYNPTRDWSLSASYGYLDSPEALSPGVNEHRTTASIAYSHDFGPTDNLSTTAYVGQKLTEGNSTPSTAWLAEATYYHARESLFARYEHVEKDELQNAPPGNYAIGKFVFGDVHTLSRKNGLDLGLGAYAGLYTFPTSLDPTYGKSPLTLGIFLRLRPSKM